MAISVATPTFPDYGDYRWIKPKVDTINPRSAANLALVLEHQYEECPEMTLDLANVKVMTNLAARILCKALYGKQEIIIENPSKAVQSSLEWAADYLYKRGELDAVPWQVSEISY
jgi:hypothetical protein